MKLSIIITTLNDSDECRLTIESALAHSDAPEIIVVDDASTQPFQFNTSQFNNPLVRIIRNKHRCGVGPSRHIGVLAAMNEIILILDSHMRMACNLNTALERLEYMPKTVMCGVCLGLDQTNMDVRKPNGEYHGATLNILGRDTNTKLKRMQVFEAVWNRSPLLDNFDLPCVMGAAYAMHRDWFLHIDPLRNLRSWGEDEVMLSVKSWLAGGDVKLNTQLRVGHKFRLPTMRVPFSIPAEDKMFNKLFAIHTLLKPDLIAKLTQHLRKSGDYQRGMRLLEANWNVVAIERERNQDIFTRDFDWLVEQFRLSIPA